MQILFMKHSKNTKKMRTLQTELLKKHLKTLILKKGKGELFEFIGQCDIFYVYEIDGQNIFRFLFSRIH